MLQLPVDTLALDSKRSSTKLKKTSLSAGSFNPKDLNTSEGLLIIMLSAQYDTD